MVRTWYVLERITYHGSICWPAMVRLQQTIAIIIYAERLSVRPATQSHEQQQQQRQMMRQCDGGVEQWYLLGDTERQIVRYGRGKDHRGRRIIGAAHCTVMPPIHDTDIVIASAQLTLHTWSPLHYITAVLNAIQQYTEDSKVEQFSRRMPIKVLKVKNSRKFLAGQSRLAEHLFWNFWYIFQQTTRFS